MKENQARVLAWIGLSEGGYVNHPSDPGGPTNRGITQRTYSAWRKLNDLPPRDVRHISKTEAERIIVEQYFAPVRFDDLPAGLDYSMADFSVNSGPARAVKTLQRLLGVADDGILGAITLEALRRVQDVGELIVRYNDARMAFLRSLSTFETFGKGWAKRVVGNRTGAQDDDIGVLDRSILLHERATDIRPPVVVAPGKAAEDPAPPPVVADMNKSTSNQVLTIILLVAAVVAGYFIRGA